MQKRLKTIATLAAAAFAAVGGAAPIPQEWAVEVSRVRQYQFQATHGDTMELKATFWHDGEPFDLGGEPFRLYWQTNAMESIYWSAPATASSNTVSAVFANTMDPGAPIVYGFLGATGGNYRASFSIRYAPGPGAVPNALPLPAATIDFAKVEVLNPPYYTKAETEEGLAVAASAATNYTDSVASTLRDDIASAASAATNYTDQAIAAADVATPSMVTNIVIDVAPQPDNYAAVNNAAMNALSRAEAEAGFTEWRIFGLAEGETIVTPLHWEPPMDWFFQTTLELYSATGAIDATNLVFNTGVTATRTRLPTMADVTLTPIYSQTPTFSEWVTNDDTYFTNIVWYATDEVWRVYTTNVGWFIPEFGGYDYYATSLGDSAFGLTATRTRTYAVIGYTLGDQSDKPLQPKGDYARKSDITNTVTKAYVESLGISAADVGATTPADVTVMIRDQSLGGIWDQDLEVWWTPVMANGSLTYQATTNVNLNAGH